MKYVLVCCVYVGKVGGVFYDKDQSLAIADTRMPWQFSVKYSMPILSKNVC